MIDIATLNSYNKYTGHTPENLKWSVKKMKARRILAITLTMCMIISILPAISSSGASYADAHKIVLSSTLESDGSYSHIATLDGQTVGEYDYTWHADPSTTHTDVKNSPAEYYTGTEPGDDSVYVAHDIYYYPELDSSGFTKQSYDGEREWVYYYTAADYSSYIFSTLPVLGNSLPTDMMHSEEEAYQNAVLHITQPGDYILEGTWHGQIWVDLENYCDDPFTDPTAKVNLILNGVSIDCTVAAGVVFYNVYECDNTWEEQSAWSHVVDTTEAGATVTLLDGTTNYVSGTNIFRILKTQYKSGSTSVQKKRLKIDGAFYSYQSMNIQGGAAGTGVLNITSGFEGLDSELHLTINGGNVYINSQDDGINVNEDGVSVLTVNGGNLHILAGLGSEGDGVDSNGYICVNGGTTITMANPGADSGMDSDSGTFVFGGNVVALGSTMDWAENDSSISYTHATMNLQFSSSRSAGDSIIVTDAEGNGIFAYDPDKDEVTGANTRSYTGAILSCDAFTVGQSYHVYIGGEITGTETMGVYDMSTVTQVTGTYMQGYGSSSSSGSMGGMGGGRPSMGGSSGSSSGSTNTTFTFTNNVNKFSGVSNSSSVATLSVTAQTGLEKPTLIPSYASVSFEDEIWYNVYFTAENLENVTQIGLLVFDTQYTDGTVEDAIQMITEYSSDGSVYMAHTDGIAAKNMGDTLYFKLFATLDDGSYVYSDMVSYSAVSYANSILRKSENPYMKALVVSMLNYGAEAQKYFGYRTDSLMNEGLTEEQQALAQIYGEDTMPNPGAVDSGKNGIFTATGFGKSSITASFDAAFAMNYYVNPTYIPDGDVTLYYWTEEDYAQAEALTLENASGSVVMRATDIANQFCGSIAGIAAKEMGKTIYAGAVYESDGVTYSTVVMNYSMGKYCDTIAGRETSAQRELSMAAAVYGASARDYFDNL